MTRPRGEQVHCAKLTEFDVRVIRQLARAGVTLTEIHGHYRQVSKVAVHKIMTGKSWRHVNER